MCEHDEDSTGGGRGGTLHLGEERNLRRKQYDPFEIRLYGATEAAEYLGLNPHNVSELLRKGRIVEPVARLACGPVWTESQLDEQAFAWRDNPREKLSPRKVEWLTCRRRLTKLERRWQALVKVMGGDSRRTDVHVYWTGAARKRRHRGKLRAIATPAEARRALAEAKLLRLVSDLRDQDPVFRGIADELDEMADLRERLDALVYAASRDAAEDLSIQG